VAIAGVIIILAVLARRSPSLQYLAGADWLESLRLVGLLVYLREGHLPMTSLLLRIVIRFLRATAP
jgi:hypothetical protein